MIIMDILSTSKAVECYEDMVNYSVSIRITFILEFLGNLSFENRKFMHVCMFVSYLSHLQL